MKFNPLVLRFQVDRSNGKPAKSACSGSGAHCRQRWT